MSIAFKGEKREELGTASARKIKKQGRIPAVIYKDKGNINLSLDGREFEMQYFKGLALTSLVEVELDGKKHKLIAHKIELDPVSDRPVHIDFLACDNLKSIRVKPKLVFTNQEKSPGLKKGGILHIVTRRVEVLCDGENHIPQEIEVDIGSLHLGSKIRSHDLKLPAGVKLNRKNNFLIGSIIGRGKSEEEKAVDPNAPATAGVTAGSPAPAGSSPAKADDKKDSKK
ncbi:MAG: 50S ribosomal protein L25/general stress protein Ctc [Alphaproteobacteria bacterium]